MSDRDLDITKFSYYAYRKLKKTLGEFDAVIECNEIAIKEFVEKAPKEKLQQYVQQLSQKHKVKVDEVDFLKFNITSHQSFNRQNNF
jgi:small ligand-binding sensory domain FIST